ncbi:hypothetical protein [Halomicrobium sp. LC1Hm]|uniref:hypothetical protein n=1 Tax=Halomicrobium sp. LC1Hm TaxID=2610902 RepID=UPI0012984E76|nr:hypothetical protein [Halomicrobium sp. LC1Hm]
MKGMIGGGEGVEKGKGTIGDRIEGDILYCDLFSKGEKGKGKAGECKETRERRENKWCIPLYLAYLSECGQCVHS